MRVELRTPFLETRPRETSRVVIAVQNTSDVIDDITVRAVGLDPTAVQSDPPRLPLFPGAEGLITLTITLPEAFPAGDHVIPLEVSSTANPAEIATVDLRLDVGVDDDIAIAVRPQNLTAGRRGEFEVLCTNRGNRPIDLTLLASDLEYSLKHEFEPPFVSLPAGHEVVSLLRVSGRRPLIGQNAIRRITITALGPDRQLTAEATFSQLPRIRRAPVTFIILASIIGLWALLFTFAINSSLATDPFTKEFPNRALESVALALGTDGEGAAAPVAGAAAARLDPMVTGGGVNGTVVAAGTNEPVGRITVEAIRQTRDGPRLATAAATDEDGAYELVGLVAGRYKLRFTAPGFEDVWYPAGTSDAAAVEISVAVGQMTDDVGVAIVGLPGGIVGSVDVGQAVAQVPVTVTARAVIDGAVGSIVAETTTDATNTYSLAPLDTPGTYELTFTTPGYQTATARERIDGGEIGVANTVRLSAGMGQITGSVTSGGQPLGGVSIQATSGEQQWATATPTSGAVGVFELVDLPTPGTYTLTFELDGFSRETIAVALGPGESLAGLNVDLAGGTGTITGQVRSGGVGLGDVTVTVSGGPAGAVTTTLTAGDVGSYRLTGLPTPALYTLTFSAEGFLPQTVSVDLRTTQSASGIDVTLARALGSIAGQVVDGVTGQPISGAEIVLTDGADEKTTLSASSPPGAFLIAGLPRGAWSLTFSRAGYQSHTVLVLLDPGQDTTISVRMTPVLASTTP
jgi:hypothetical protein